MTKKETAVSFDARRVRSVFDDDTEEWYFSVVDVVGVLTDSPDPGAYWRKLKERLKKEGNETVTNCHRLKIHAADGKLRVADMGTPEQMFRIIQSIPSPKAEPFKRWMATVAARRLDQMQDPELSINQAMADYKRLGYSDAWINQRLKSIEVRKDLTDEWRRSGVTDSQYALLTDLLTKRWSGMTTRQYKNHKCLRKESLRDNMTNIELALNTLAEAATTEISRQRNPRGLDANSRVAESGGDVAKAARDNLERQLGRSVVTRDKARDHLLPPDALPGLPSPEDPDEG